MERFWRITAGAEVQGLEICASKFFSGFENPCRRWRGGMAVPPFTRCETLR